MKYFIYARKSTDSEERQVLSIESQLQELRDFARRENLEIIDEFNESKTAKEPGREVFNLMLSRIEKENIEGVLAWHPDRLARNSIDGGRIIYLIDTGYLSKRNHLARRIYTKETKIIIRKGRNQGKIRGIWTEGLKSVRTG